MDVCREDRDVVVLVVLAENEREAFFSALLHPPTPSKKAMEAACRYKEKMTKPECYLGNGLYASFDGYMVRLRASRQAGDDYVFMESVTVENFIRFVERVLFVR